MRIVVLSSLAYSLVNFRGTLLRTMAAGGHEVIAVAPDRDPLVEAELAAAGIGFRHIPMHRTGATPLGDLKLLLSYRGLLREVRPDLVLAYTQKPIIYGGLAARLAGGVRFFALMSGLGYAFTPGSGIAGWMREVVRRLYRAGVRRSEAIFVFNSADRQDMLDLGIIDRDLRVVQVPGSGIDIERFARAPLPEKPHFLMIARLMRDKGVMEFLEAAKQVTERHPECRFSILGHFETQNPTGLGEAECADLASRYPVRFCKPTSDVRPYLADCTAFVLPSYYREGLPRTILEALATGRPVVTTDTPGCRDAVTDGVNGFVVPPRDAGAVTQAMLRLLEEPGLVREMGENARRVAEDIYDVHKVNAQLLGEMKLPPGAGPADPQPSTETSAASDGRAASAIPRVAAR